MKANLFVKEMNQCFVELNEAEQESVLKMVKTFLKSKHVSKRISIDQYNKEIDKAMARMDAGKFVTQEDVEKESAKW
jgi:hypothetical protein